MFALRNIVMQLQQYYDALQQCYDVIRFNDSDNVSNDIILTYFHIIFSYIIRL